MKTFGASLPVILIAFSLYVTWCWSTRTPLLAAGAEGYNVRVGTQTFAGRYQFTTNSLLVETAQAIAAMGSDIIKFYHGPDYQRQYGIRLPDTITNLATLAREEPSARAVFEMPFRHYVMWVYPLEKIQPFDGYSDAEARAEYREIYDFTAYLLTEYNGSGKTFYFGHWEGDWYLLPSYNTTTNPSPAAIRGMIAWLNQRQKAIDDAKRDIAHTNVQIYGYAEVNRVVDAMSADASRNQRMINCVIPAVTNLDFVSWSAYDIQDASTEQLHATLDYMRSKLPTSKAAAIPGERIWIGEYGWGIPDGQTQERRSREFIQRLFKWRSGPRFILFWQIHNNEPGRAFWLIDENNVKQPAYYLHRNFISKARARINEYQTEHRRLPTEAEFGPLVSPILDSSPVP